MSGACSTVELPSAKVIEMASATIARIKERRSEEDAARIAIERGGPIGWFRRALGRSVPTDEEIAAELASERFPVFPSCYAWMTLETASRLLRAAKIADVVRVSIEDIEAIS